MLQISRNKWWRKIKQTLFSHTLTSDIAWHLFFKPPKVPQTNKKKNPVVSVAIPIYTNAQNLIESVEAIINQTFQDFELILICDDSSKEILDIVHSYARDNKKIRVYYLKDHENNRCPARAQNKAIREARGRYFAFQYSVDIAEPDRLENSIYEIENLDIDIVYGGWRLLTDKITNINLADSREFFSADFSEELLRTDSLCQSTVMTKTDALRDVGGLKEKINFRADHELWLRLANYGYQFKSIHKVLTNSKVQPKNNLEPSNEKEDARQFQLLKLECKKKNIIKPKIAYVIPGTRISGGIAVVCEHVNRLFLRGYDVSIISEDNLHGIPWFPQLLVPVTPLKQIAGESFDIVVATGWTTAYTARKLDAKRKFYFVQSDESRFYPSKDIRSKKAIETYEMDFEFITMAQWIKSWLKKDFGKESTHVPNGINEKTMFPDQPVESKGNKVRVLLEGAISIPFKGMEDAFMAVNDLDCEVWCVSSSGKPKPEWKCDRFFERIPFGQMRHIYSSCDILLKMSRIESFCYPPLEMMACGGTAVVGVVTGIEEYIVDGYNALVVKQGDIQGAHNALKKLIGDEDLRNELISNGMKTTNKFRWDPSIDILEDIFLGFK